MATDVIDDAIAAVNGRTVEMVQVQIKLLNDRPAMLAVPKDITELELLNLVGAVLQIGDQLRAAPRRIVLPK